MIRHVILSGAAKPLGPEAETMLFASARDDHLRTTIRPALARGDWVICDRFADSTRIYQGDLGTVDPRLIGELERITVGATIPDLTFDARRTGRRGAGARAAIAAGPTMRIVLKAKRWNSIKSCATAFVLWQRASPTAAS